MDKELFINYIDTKTKEEILTELKINEKQYEEYCDEFGCRTKYLRRTNLTQGLIPINSSYGSKKEKELDKLSAGMREGWHKHELDVTQKMLKENDSKLGVALAQVSTVYKDCLNIANASAVLRHHVDNLDKNQNNYIKFYEENQYGNINKFDSLEGIKELLNDDIILGWLSHKVGLATLMLVSKELKEKGEVTRYE